MGVPGSKERSFSLMRFVRNKGNPLYGLRPPMDPACTRGRPIGVAYAKHRQKDIQKMDGRAYTPIRANRFQS